MTDEPHSLSVLKEELSKENEFLFSFSEDIDYHTRMLAMKRKEHKECLFRIGDLEETIKSLEGKLHAGTQE